MVSFGAHPHEGSLTNLLDAGAHDELRRALSADQRVMAETPPTFLWHTADDQSVPGEHSLIFAGALSRHGVPFELHVYPHGRHGLGLALDDPVAGSWTALCARWLAGQGFRTSDTAASGTASGEPIP